MKIQTYSASSRGFASHGWLKSFHSFSFASYYNPKRMGFGALRVVNDDQVAPRHGFSTHPHANMEIVSIPLAGVLRHRDSTGHEQTISAGEVQIMSAGTGIRHSEMNASDTESVSFLQIWVKPRRHNITPRYEQKRFEKSPGQLQLVVSPDDLTLDGVKINQESYFWLGHLTAGQAVTHPTSKPTAQSTNTALGQHVFVLSGEVEVNGVTLQTRDIAEITEADVLSLVASADTELLIIEVPI